MDWLTTIWTAFISLSVALSGVYFVRWLRRRELLTLVFVLFGISIALQGATEIWMFRASTVEEYGAAVRWFHVPVFMAFCSYVAVVHLTFETSRLWLGLLACALRFLSLLVNFVQDPNINYAELTGITSVAILGEDATIGIGVPSPWMAVGQLALLLLFAYLLDAAVSAWRRDRDAPSAALGLALGLLALGGIYQGVTVFWGLVQAPLLGAPLFIGVALILGAKAGLQMIRAEQLSEELMTSKAKLEQASHAAAMSELSGALAHEINQPLGVIMSNAEAASLMLQGDQADREELRDIVNDIIAADRRAADVILRLRGLLKRNEPMLEDCQIADVIEEAIGHLAEDLRNDRISLNRHEAEALPLIRADSILLVQVIMNLLDNAREAVLANPPGQRLVTIGSAVEARNVVVIVRDNGTGLTVDPAEIFDAFVTTKETGLGMGLAIAKSVIEAHEGRLEAESRDGGGALFRVSIPRK